MTYKDHIEKISEHYTQSRKEQSFSQEEINSEKFYYVVPMFPYPSGKIHMGHIRNYAISNVVAQYKKNKGYKVLHPIGFDSFGMPAENAAIKHKVSPKSWTESNIATMTNDFKRASFDFDYVHSVQTHRFDYYKFEQDIFKRAYKEGLIYKKEQYVNYDPVDKTVLSNEQVINGTGWRTGAKIIRKKIPMYYFNMKKYAERLNSGLESIASSWPSKVVQMQKNWINIEKGTEYHFAFSDTQQCKAFISEKHTIEDVHSVIMGINNNHVKIYENSDRFKDWLKQASEGGVSEKDNYAKKNYYVTNDFVAVEDKVFPILIDINGDEEAKFDKYKTNVVEKGDVGKVIYKETSTSIGLKDWCISRQRYWGNPIPMVFCESCGDVPENDYVKLPDDLVPDGNGNVLEKENSFKDCNCPQCGKPATRCTDTMDTFVQSSWYFHRYINPKSEKMIPNGSVQIDHYIGGVEHATMHLIYTRFFHKMLYDFGMVTTEEPIKKLTTQGMVCKKYTKPDGSVVSAKMSKSIGNIVEPKEYIDKYGSDALQMFMIFAAPPHMNFDFEDAGIVGCYRFLEQVYRYFFVENNVVKNVKEQDAIAAVDKLEKYIEQEFENRFNLNTTIPQIMTCFKTIQKTIFTDTENKRNVENRFIESLSIFAPQLSQYVKDYYFSPTDKKQCKI